MFVSWRHQETDFATSPAFDDKVDIFYERIWGWQLHVAELCLNGGKGHDGRADLHAIPHSAFAALQIMLAYFEMIAKYEDGFVPSGRQGRSGHYFKEGVKSVFPDLGTQEPSSVDSFLDTLYENVRCGLYHMSQTEVGIVLTGDYPQVMGFSPANQQLVINPHGLPTVLKSHLADYRNRLLDSANTELRGKFELRFDHDNPNMA